MTLRDRELASFATDANREHHLAQSAAATGIAHAVAWALVRERREAEHKALARATGGGLARCYASIRAALADADRQSSETVGEQRRLIVEAIADLHRAESHLVDAMREARGEQSGAA